MKTFTIILVLSVMALSSIAQSPQAFSYQAVVRDAAGEILQNQAVGIRISIHDVTADGAIIYQETFSDTTNQFGLVNLEIGDGTPTIGIFSGIDWGSNSKFLEFEIDAAGGSNYLSMGTSQLISVPYALYSENTANKDDADADPTNELQTVSKVGNTVTLSDGGGSFVDETTDADADPTNELNTSVSLEGTNLKVTDAGGTITTDMGSLVDDADANPTNEMQTVSKAGNTVTLSDGGGSFVDETEDEDANPENEFQNLSIFGNDLTISDGNTVALPTALPYGYNGNTLFHNGSDWEATENLFHNGTNIGIGTLNPSRKLDVDFGDIIVQGPESFDAIGEQATLYLGTVHNYIKSEYGYGLKIGTYAVADALAIEEISGNVGIGTTIPAYKLSVAGQLNLNQGIVSGNALRVNGIPAIGLSDLVYSWGSGNAYTNFFDGNVGIGTYAPATDLHISMPATMLRGQFCITDDTADDPFITFYEGETFKSYVGTIDGVAQWGSMDGSEMIIGAYGGGNVGIGADLLNESSMGLFSKNNKEGTKSNEITHRLTVKNAEDDNVLRLIGPDGEFLGYGAKLNFGDGDYAYIEEDADDKLVIHSDRVAFTGGNVGIGTLIPDIRLHIDGGYDISPVWGGYFVVGNIAGTNIGMDDNEIMARDGGNVSYLNINREGGNVIINELAGNVGIGTTSPTYKLTVRGNIMVESANTGLPVVELGEGLDYAEGFDLSESNKPLPGTVLIIDVENPGELKVSEKAYDSKVVGIVAGANKLGSGVTLGSGQFDCNVALAGRVYCNVDATYGEISAGDLLTTSPTAGYAMAVQDHSKSSGAILGKAMENLEKGKKGQILVLVTLQ